MDPMSAMIGAGSSLIGGLMNTSSQQAINTANIANAQSMARGDYLPGLVANANAAGLSPLAVLGMHAPSVPAMISGDPGSGLQRAGQVLSQVKDPHTQRMEELQEKLGQANIMRSLIETSNSKLEGDQRALVIERLKGDKSLDLSLRPDWISRFGEMFGAAAEGVDKALPGLGARINSSFQALDAWSRRQPGGPEFVPPGFIPAQ